MGNDKNFSGFPKNSSHDFSDVLNAKQLSSNTIFLQLWSDRTSFPFMVTNWLNSFWNILNIAKQFA